MIAAKSNANFSLTMNKETETRYPLPDNFELYLPWAYSEMQGETGLVVIKITQNDYITPGRSSDRSKAKGKRSRVMPSPIEVERSDTWQPRPVSTAKELKIIATYDQSDNLVHIKFDRPAKIPRKVMKLIGIIVKFHPHLTGVTINRGLDMHIVHDLGRWLPISGITDICLDGTFVEEGNYDILLEHQSLLRNLSLARCSINDNVVKNIASKLVYPLAASKTLALLNLASNRITDLGAKHISEALRSNRKLYYLNLADNMISDEGVSSILDILTEFPLNMDEIMAMRAKHMNYLKQKTQLTERILKDLKAGDFDRKAGRRKSVKGTPTTAKKLKGLERDNSAKVLVDASMLNMEVVLSQKAEMIAKNMLGHFHGPFSSADTKIMDDVTHCLGNNALCYLNLAYNNLCYVSVKKLLNVVLSQKVMDRKPRGLVNVCIEGNNIPDQCTELANIDEILESTLRGYSSKISINKKRPTSKSTSVK